MYVPTDERLIEDKSFTLQFVISVCVQGILIKANLLKVKKKVKKWGTKTRKLISNVRLLDSKELHSLHSYANTKVLIHYD